MLNTRIDAYKFLESMSAPEHLKTHVKLVGEAADLLIQKCQGMSLTIDADFIRTGVAIHDLGKIIHQNEMTGGGSEHEPEGQRMLLEAGASAKLARVCMSHARWHKMECSVEELLIALSDKLWKGNRVELLELQVIDKLAELLGVDRWDIYTDLDSCFEEIASGGHDRLQRSAINKTGI